MFQKFKKIKCPEKFQGRLDGNKYFEGWYFKLVSQDEDIALAVIPGISLVNNSERHAFIQVLDGKEGKSFYYEFPITQFSYNKDYFEIQIGDNYFSSEKMAIKLPVLYGQIEISNQHPFPKSLFSPGVMGWYSYIPFMQCYHGIVSTFHHLNGKLMFNGKSKEFINGIGYIEKDWGSSFPKCWIWTHSNHFSGREVSFMASVAHIPWLGSYFIGFIVFLEIEGVMYKFATYTGAKMKATIEDNRVKLQFKKGSHVLSVEAKPGKSATLKSPLSGRMTGKVNESLQAELDIQFVVNEVIIFKGIGTSAGLEVAGPTDVLLTQEWR